MAVFRVFLHTFLFLSVLCVNAKSLDKIFECKFTSCRDCSSWNNCVWNIYFNGDERCAMKSQWSPGVEAKATSPNKCNKPDCVVPKRNACGLKGIAQIFGGLLGGLTAGFLAGVGIQSIRSGRNIGGYQRIGPDENSWTEFFGQIVVRLCRFDCVGRQDQRNSNTHDLRQNDENLQQLREMVQPFRMNDRTLEARAESEPSELTRDLPNEEQDFHVANQQRSEKDNLVEHGNNSTSTNNPGRSDVVAVVFERRRNLSLKGNTIDETDSDDYDDDEESPEGIDEVQSPSYYETDDED